MKSDQNRQNKPRQRSKVVKLSGYQNERKVKRIFIGKWNELSLIVQGNYCKKYDVILTYKKISQIDNFLIKFDVRNFKLEDIPKGIEIINTNIEKIGKGIEKFNDIVGSFGNIVGKVGTTDNSKNPFKNLFGKNEFNLNF